MKKSIFVLSFLFITALVFSQTSLPLTLTISGGTSSSCNTCPTSGTYTPVATAETNLVGHVSFMPFHWQKYDSLTVLTGSFIFQSNTMGSFEINTPTPANILNPWDVTGFIVDASGGLNGMNNLIAVPGGDISTGQIKVQKNIANSLPTAYCVTLFYHNK